MQTDFLVLQDGNELSSKGFGKGKGKIGGEKSEGEDSGFLSTMIGIADEQAASTSRSSEEPDPKEAAPDPSSRGKSRPEDEPGAKGNDTSRARTNSLEIAQVLGNGKAQDQGSGPLKSVRPERTKPTAPGLDRGNQASLDRKEGSNKPSRVSNLFGMKEAQNVTGEARDHKTEKGTLDETRDPKEPVPARTEGRSRGKIANINIDTKRAEGRGDDRGGVKGPLDETRDFKEPAPARTEGRSKGNTAKRALEELAPARTADRSGGEKANINIDTARAEGRGDDRGGVKGPLDETRDLKEPVPARTEGRSRGKTANINIDTKRAEGRGDDRGGVKGPLDETRDLKEPAPPRTEGRSRGKKADINIDAGKAGVKNAGLMTSRKGGPTEEISLKEGRGGSKPELLFDQDGVHRNRDKKGRLLRYNAYLSGENNRSDYIEKGVPARVPSQGPANLSQDLQAITLKAKNHTGGSSHRRVGKAETSSGENSFLSSNSHSSADKASGTTLHAKGSETTRRAFQNNGLKQIVEKASFAIKNFQPGITINLKPEFLGHVKIRITTENHLVSVKIMAEIPLVKEMIETNLNQLKADLQDHGLEVDRLDVSLAPDSGKNWAGDEKTGFQKKKEETRGKDRSDQRSLEKGEAMMRLGGEYGETGVVNYFA